MRTRPAPAEPAASFAQQHAACMHTCTLPMPLCKQQQQQRALGMLASASSDVGQNAVDLPPMSTCAPRWSTRTTVPCTCDVSSGAWVRASCASPTAVAAAVAATLAWPTPSQPGAPYPVAGVEGQHAGVDELLEAAVERLAVHLGLRLRLHRRLRLQRRHSRHAASCPPLLAPRGGEGLGLGRHHGRTTHSRGLHCGEAAQTSLWQPAVGRGGARRGWLGHHRSHPPQHGLPWPPAALGGASVHMHCTVALIGAR